MEQKQVNNSITERVFDHFFVQNKPLYQFTKDRNIERLYEHVDSEYEFYQSRYEELGYRLERHQYFFLLSKKEPKKSVKAALEKFRKWIVYRKILNTVYFKYINEAEDIRFNEEIQKAQILISLDKDPTLKGMLLKLPNGSESKELTNIIDKMFADLCEWCVLEEVSHDNGKYLITGFIEYFNELTQKLALTEIDHENA